MALDNRACARRRQAARASGSSLEALRRDVRLQTQQFYLDVVSGAARLRALDQARISSASALQSSKTGRDVGVRTTLDVLNAEQSYYQTLYDRTAARYQYLFSRLQLAASLGELTDRQLAVINTWLNSSPSPRCRRDAAVMSLKKHWFWEPPRSCSSAAVIAHTARQPGGCQE